MLPDAYGCVVANRFGELLDDDADPFDLLSMAESTEKSKKKKKPGQKESQKERRAGVDEQPAPPMGMLPTCSRLFGIRHGHVKQGEVDVSIYFCAL